MKNEKANLQKWQGRFFKLSSFVLVGFIIWIFILICRYLHQIASTIGYSVLIAYLLIGLVDWVHSKARLRKRGLAILIVYIAIFFAFTAFALFVFPNLITQLQSLISQLPSYPQKMQTWLNTYNLKTAETGLDFLNINWEILSQKLTVYLNKTSSGFFSRFFELAFGTINFAIHALTTLVLSVYFLLDGPKIWQGIVSPLSPKYLAHADNLRRSLNLCLRSYFIGQIQLSALSGIFIFIVYLSLGSKYALLLGIWQALIEIIPVVGGFAGIGLGVLVLLFDSPFKALIALLAYFAYTQIIKDNFLAPRVMGNAIGLHPVIVLVVVLIGAHIGGVSGVVFALPITGLLNVVFEYYLAHRYDDDEQTVKLELNK